MPHPFPMMFVPGGANAFPGGMDPMQVIFGLSQGGPVDPAVVQQVFGGAFQMHHQEPEPERRTGPPPTSAAVLRRLPKIKVTAYDIIANEGSECSICLGDLEPGENAVRLHCSHLYHEECITEWLKKSNECPVCRFELPTDNEEYERGRESRMAGRKLRMRRSDLEMKSAQELRHMAQYLRIDVRDCLEKVEVVQKIAASPKVHIVQAEQLDSPNSLSAGAQRFSHAQLSSMSIGEVHAVMERLGVDAQGSTDKADLVARLCNSGRILLSDDRPEPREESTPEVAKNGDNSKISTSTSGSGAGDVKGAPARPDASFSVSELRRIAQNNGVHLYGCVEKGDIVERLRAAGL